MLQRRIAQSASRAALPARSSPLTAAHHVSAYAMMATAPTPIRRCNAPAAKVTEEGAIPTKTFKIMPKQQHEWDAMSYDDRRDFLDAQKQQWSELSHEDREVYKRMVTKARDCGWRPKTLSSTLKKAKTPEEIKKEQEAWSAMTPEQQKEKREKVREERKKEWQVLSLEQRIEKRTEHEARMELIHKERVALSKARASKGFQLLSDEEKQAVFDRELKMTDLRMWEPPQLADRTRYLKQREIRWNALLPEEKDAERAKIAELKRKAENETTQDADSDDPVDPTKKYLTKEARLDRLLCQKTLHAMRKDKLLLNALCDGNATEEEILAKFNQKKEFVRGSFNEKQSRRTEIEGELEKAKSDPLEKRPELTGLSPRLRKKLFAARKEAKSRLDDEGRAKFRETTRTSKIERKKEVTHQADQKIADKLKESDPAHYKKLSGLCMMTIPPAEWQMYPPNDRAAMRALRREQFKTMSEEEQVAYRKKVHTASDEAKKAKQQQSQRPLGELPKGKAEAPKKQATKAAAPSKTDEADA